MSAALLTNAAHAADVLLFEGYFKNGSDAEFGILLTRENPADDESRQIGVAFTRFAASGEVTAPPLFVMPGGPGFSYRDVSAAQQQASPSLAVFQRLRQYQDVVVMEQRGGQHSFPYLDCQAFVPEGTAVRSPEDLEAATRATSTACRRAWLDKGVDLKSYTVDKAAADVDAVRRALGYDKINVAGNSFGSHWTMAVLRYHGEHVNAALLSGLEGPDHTFDTPSEVRNALQRVADVAASEPGLADVMPEQGLIAALEEVIVRLDSKPVAVDGMTLSGSDVRAMARGFPYASNRLAVAEWPAMVIELHRGDYTRLAAFAAGRREFEPDSAMYYVMDCASGGTDARRERNAADPAMELMGNINAGYNAACAVWTDADMGETFRAGFTTSVPTVMYQGNWDVSTPMENALSIREIFEDHRLVIADRATHAQVWHTLYRNEAFFDAIQNFFESGDFSEVPERIQVPVEPFALPSSTSWP
ncbi:MAG: alpha/beta hydrolase [Pseudomonadota bacterium]